MAHCSGGEGWQLYFAEAVKTGGLGGGALGFLLVQLEDFDFD
jgi:hypothetical protein